MTFMLGCLAFVGMYAVASKVEKIFWTAVRRVRPQDDTEKFLKLDWNQVQKVRVK